MYKSFRNVLHFGRVLVSGEPSEPFFEHINPKGIIAGHQYIYPKVVLEIVDEMWIGNVLRNEHIFLVAY